jgi:cytochrome b561
MATRYPATTRYSQVAIAFHWTIAALVVFNIAVGLGHDPIPALRALMPAHKAVGITVLALTVLRGRGGWRTAPRRCPRTSRPGNAARRTPRMRRCISCCCCCR